MTGRKITIEGKPVVHIRKVKKSNDVILRIKEDFFLLKREKGKSPEFERLPDNLKEDEDFKKKIIWFSDFYFPDKYNTKD